MVDSWGKIIGDWASAWSSAGGSEQFVSLFTGDVEYEDVAAGHHLHGQIELGRFYQLSRTVFPDFKIAITSLVCAADRACAEWRMTGTQAGDLPDLPATHRRISMRGVSVFERHTDKLRRVTDYYDKASMIAQLTG
jgi:steroid delta-isomerase-like uncharacterized protein